MGLFSGSKATAPTTFDSRTPERKQYDQFIAKYMAQYEPGKTYGGQFNAPASSYERQGLEQFLTQYLNAPDISGQTGDARNLLNKTITGGFDPGTAPYYQALRDTAGYNRNKAVTDTNADLGARNKYFSSEAVTKYGDINAQTSNALNLAMAELANKERDRSMQAVPQATQLEDYISKIPLQKATAATTIGSIPRMLEQADLESLYQDFIRRQKELGTVAGQGSSITSNLDVVPGKPAGKSTFESFIGPLLLQAIPALMTGGASLPFTTAAAGASAAIPALTGSQGNPGGFWANI